MDIEKCTGCGVPAHPSETDDDGYHAACRPVTGETVTDEQIEELRRDLRNARGYSEPPLGFECPGGRISDWIATCSTALAIYETPGDPDRMAARASCARLINAARGAK